MKVIGDTWRVNARLAALTRPLDPARPHGPHLRIGFEWLPPRGRARGPALVAVEGGPGYPSSGSYFEYHGIFSPLIGSRGLLLVDQHGTGMSALIDCKRVQTFTARTSGPAFAARVAACARQIERRYPGVHAADLFGTAYAADDLAAVLRVLRSARWTCTATRTARGSRSRSWLATRGCSIPSRSTPSAPATSPAPPPRQGTRPIGSRSCSPGCALPRSRAPRATRTARVAGSFTVTTPGGTHVRVTLAWNQARAVANASEPRGVALALPAR